MAKRADGGAMSAWIDRDALLLASQLASHVDGISCCRLSYEKLSKGAQGWLPYPDCSVQELRQTLSDKIVLN